MKSEFSANKDLFETYQAAKAVAKLFNNGKAEAKLSDMQSMKEFQAKNKAFGKAKFLVD